MEQQYNYLLRMGDWALRRNELGNARRYYCESISEVNLCLQRSRAQYSHVEPAARALRLVSMIVVSHHNLADLYAEEGGRVKQTRYLEMAHQKLVDVVRDSRFNQFMRASALREMKRTYAVLVSHYKTHCLNDVLTRLNSQYCRLNRTFSVLL